MMVLQFLRQRRRAALQYAEGINARRPLRRGARQGAMIKLLTDSVASIPAQDTGDAE
ncbi:MAG: hypothetical protein ACLT98_03925 [Eggerthellaceae bacterium]